MELEQGPRSHGHSRTLCQGLWPGRRLSIVRPPVGTAFRSPGDLVVGVVHTQHTIDHVIKYQSLNAPFVSITHLHVPAREANHFYMVLCIPFARYSPQPALQQTGSFAFFFRSRLSMDETKVHVGGRLTLQRLPPIGLKIGTFDQFERLVGL